VLPVMIKCPTTTEMAWTGLARARITLDDIADPARFEFRCPVCGRLHTWRKADAWLEDDGEGEEPSPA
jgi:hypothetical protein